MRPAQLSFSVNLVQMQLGCAFADEKLATDLLAGPALSDHAGRHQFERSL